MEVVVRKSSVNDIWWSQVPHKILGTHGLWEREWSIFVVTSTTHNRTHKLQPLDRAVFKPLKFFFNNACEMWKRNHPGRRIQTENLRELFRESYLKSATLENAVSCFQTGGIVPFNSDIVPADEYIEYSRIISIATTLTDGDTTIPTNENSLKNTG